MVVLTLILKAISVREMLVAVTAFLITWFIIKTYRKGRLDIPGPFPWPIIGNGLSMGDDPRSFFQRMAKEYGRLYQIKLGNVTVVVITKRDVIREALVRQKSTFSGRPLFQSFANISYGKGVAFNSVLTSGEQFTKNKAAILKHIHLFATSMNTRSKFSRHIRSEIAELVKVMTKSSNQSKDGFVQNPESKITVSVANVICALVFGKRYDYDNKEFRDLISLNVKFGEVVGAGSQVDVMPWITIFPYFKKKADTFTLVNNRTNNWARMRMEEHEKDYDKDIIRDIVDSMATCMDDKEQILALAIDIFGATQDTMSAAVQWMFIYLTMFPEYQKKIRKEMENYIAGSTELPDMQRTGELPVTEAFVHEVFRHSSFVGSTIPHFTLRDTELLGYRIPRNTVVFVDQNSMNNDPDEWENPRDFNPERFLDESNNVDSRQVDRYMIFSIGERKCPGKQLATLWIRYFVAIFLYICEIEQDPNQPANFDSCGVLSTRPKNLRVKLKVLRPELLDQMQDNKRSAHDMSPNQDDDVTHKNGLAKSSLGIKGGVPNGITPKNRQQDSDVSDSNCEETASDRSDTKEVDAVNNNKTDGERNIVIQYRSLSEDVSDEKYISALAKNVVDKTRAENKVVEILDGTQFCSNATSRIHKVTKRDCALADPV